MRYRIMLLIALGLVSRAGGAGLVLGQDAKIGGPGEPRSPKEAQKLFKLPDGLRIELIACEPQIESPVAMTFDEKGRLWVVEMRDYPNGPEKGKPPEGRIRILEDKDGDGFYETSTVFADKLLFANGILRWKDGVVVTMAPKIVFMREKDGKLADTEVLYEGFTPGNPQLRVSHPILGLDGFVYVANGLRGGKVKAAGKKDAKEISLSGMDFRFNLLTGEHEAITGMGQYGNAFDDWSNRFVCDNRHHLRHIVLENRYLASNPAVSAAALVEDISILDEGPLSSGGKIYPISKNWTTSNLHEGRFTAACGVFIYRGGLLPKEYNGAAFTCDPTGNLVHMETLTPSGPTFTSRPSFKEKEFLATPDDWCRPVFLTHGPDDAMYVVDMYRAVIEHPEFMPPELKTRPDLTLGKEKGRIWRIVAEGKRAARKTLEGKTAAELGAALGSANAWERGMAFRLLLERQDKANISRLRELVAKGNLIGRVGAAWLLNSLSALKDDEVAHLLADKDSRVAAQAILLAETRKDPSPAIREQIRKLARTGSGRLAYQAILTLGAWNDAAVDDLVPALTSADRWLRLAATLGLKDKAGEMVAALLRDAAFHKLPAERRKDALLDVSRLVGARADAGETRRLLSDLREREADAAAVLTGVAEGLSRRGLSLRGFLVKIQPDASDPVYPWLDGVIERSVKRANDEKAPRAERLEAVALIREAKRDQAEKRLFDLLQGEHAPEIKLAAARALGRFADKAVAERLIGEWKSLSPSLRREVVEVLLRQPETLDSFFSAVETKKIKPSEIDPLRSRQLLAHPQPAVRERAKKLLAAALPADRKEVLDRYQAVLKLTGDPKKGKMLFTKHCVTCHKVAGIGLDVGPDISDTRTRTPAALLTDILNPNQAIDANYIQYVVTTKDGRILTGMVATETATSVTLKRAEGQTDTVPRANIESIESTGMSLMPEGFERQITVEEMADLIAFLKNWRYLDGSVPLGKE
ncbi:MAG: PVC-type heme-binding CxxCH protein [Gemmataceae bacterium]